MYSLTWSKKTPNKQKSKEKKNRKNGLKTRNHEKSVIATVIIYVYVSEAIYTVYISTVHTCIHTHIRVSWSQPMLAQHWWGQHQLLSRGPVSRAQRGCCAGLGLPAPTGAGGCSGGLSTRRGGPGTRWVWGSGSAETCTHTRRQRGASRVQAVAAGLVFELSLEN